MSLLVKIRKLREDAIIPNQPYDDDAGFDLYTVEDSVIKSSERTQVSTGIAMSIPYGYVGLIWDKSGIAMKQGQKTLGGVVDAGYRGEIRVGMINLSDKEYTFKKGEKVAQMLIQKVEKIQIEEVENLYDTERGEKGFGSSGK